MGEKGVRGGWAGLCGRCPFVPVCTHVCVCARMYMRVCVCVRARWGRSCAPQGVLVGRSGEVGSRLSWGEGIERCHPVSNKHVLRLSFPIRTLVGWDPSLSRPGSVREQGEGLSTGASPWPPPAPACTGPGREGRDWVHTPQGGSGGPEWGPLTSHPVRCRRGPRGGGAGAWPRPGRVHSGRQAQAGPMAGCSAQPWAGAAFASPQGGRGLCLLFHTLLGAVGVVIPIVQMGTLRPGCRGALGLPLPFLLGTVIKGHISVTPPNSLPALPLAAPRRNPPPQGALAFSQRNAKMSICRFKKFLFSKKFFYCK